MFKSKGGQGTTNRTLKNVEEKDRKILLDTK